MPINAQRQRLAPPGRSPLLILVVAAGALLSMSACEDDSPATRDGGTVHPDTERTPVDTTGGDGTGTVLSLGHESGRDRCAQPERGRRRGNGRQRPLTAQHPTAGLGDGGSQDRSSG